MLTSILAGIALLLFGIAFCFYGFKAIQVLLPVLGFVINFYLGVQFMQNVLSEGIIVTALSLVVGLVLGILGAIGAYFFLIFAVALVAGLVGYAVAAQILPLFGLDTGCIAFLLGLAVGFGTAWLTIRYNLTRYVLIVFTAILGAIAIVLSLLMVFNQISPDQIFGPTGIIGPILKESPIYIILLLGLFGVGIYIQLLASRDYDFAGLKLFGRQDATPE
jgi:hypothetical protein